MAVHGTAIRVFLSGKKQGVDGRNRSGHDVDGAFSIREARVGRTRPSNRTAVGLTRQSILEVQQILSMNARVRPAHDVSRRVG
jgi:hypothetical protein